MKQVLVVFALVFVLKPLIEPATATTRRWTGWITDDHCGAKGANTEHVSCAQKCVDNGSKLILYCNADEKLYMLDNQELARQHLGHAVAVRGSLEGYLIVVSSIEMVVLKGDQAARVSSHHAHLRVIQ